MFPAGKGGSSHRLEMLVAGQSAVWLKRPVQEVPLEVSQGRRSPLKRTSGHSPSALSIICSGPHRKRSVDCWLCEGRRWQKNWSAIVDLLVLVAWYQSLFPLSPNAPGPTLSGSTGLIVIHYFTRYCDRVLMRRECFSRTFEQCTS